MSSISAMGGNPPARSNALRPMNMAWSPVAMPVRRERRFMDQAITASMGCSPSMCTSKRPQACCVLCWPIASRTSLSASVGRRVSACRNSSASPRAALAPAFICTARPREVCMTISASPLPRARSAVPSWLPPSTTTISAPRDRAVCSACKAARMPALSFSTGTMMDSCADGSAFAIFMSCGSCHRAHGIGFMACGSGHRRRILRP